MLFFFSACQAIDWNDREKKRLLTFMNSYDLHPLALIDKSNTEHNVLAHDNNLKYF